MGTDNKWLQNYKDPRWQKKRLEIMERDGFACAACGDKKSTLNVHHAYYDKGKMPWEYSNRTLITLCEKCHKERHGMQKEILAGLSGLSTAEYFGVYHMLVIADSRTLTEAIGVYVSEYDSFIDYDGLSNILPALASAYQLGKEDNE